MDIQPQKKFNILLIGDDCVDEYQQGIVERISPEAPVPVFKPTTLTTKPGMAANVRENLLALDCDVSYLHGNTSVKTRLIDSRSGQQIVRIDKDVISESLQIESEIPEIYDAVVISDYDKGTVSYELIEDIIEHFKKPIFVDTKKQDLARFHGCFLKINETEYNKRWSINSSMIVTLGERGAMYKTRRDPSSEIYFDAPKVEVVDVTGAGDTFLAAVCVEYLRTNDIQESIKFAIQASSITVQHRGVYAPLLEEIK